MTLRTGTLQACKDKYRYYKEARAALRLIPLLPKNLQQLNGTLDTEYNGQASLFISTWNNKGRDLMKEAKLAGIQGLKTTMSSLDNWYAHGEAILPNGVHLQVTLCSLPQPPACHIESHEETRTVYTAICDETGQEIK